MEWVSEHGRKIVLREDDIHLAEGHLVTKELVDQIITSELAKIAEAAGDAYDSARYAEAVDLFKEVALADDYVEFLTLPAYERMP